MTLRRICVSLLTVAVVGAGGAFVRQQWRDFRAGVRKGQHRVGGRRKLIAARNTGIFRTRLECATHHQVSVGSRCSPDQWDAWFPARHGGPRQLARCRTAGPNGPEGAPPTTAKATISNPVGPLSGPPTDCGTLTTYQLPDPKVVATTNPMGSRPGAVAVDPDGSVWFTEFLSGSISHMTVDGKVTRRALPTQPSALVRDPDGNLWFTDNVTNAIWRLSPDGETRRLPMPQTGAPGAGPLGPADLTVAADGRVWFIESQGGRLARVNPDSRSPRCR